MSALYSSSLAGPAAVDSSDRAGHRGWHRGGASSRRSAARTLRVSSDGADIFVVDRAADQFETHRLDLAGRRLDPPLDLVERKRVIGALVPIAFAVEGVKVESGASAVARQSSRSGQRMRCIGLSRRRSRRRARTAEAAALHASEPESDVPEANGSRKSLRSSCCVKAAAGAAMAADGIRAAGIRRCLAGSDGAACSARLALLLGISDRRAPPTASVPISASATWPERFAGA